MKLTKRNTNKGFTMVELIVVVAILAVLIAVLVPSVMKYVENSRMESDDSAMNEVAHSIKLAMSDIDVFDEVCAQAVENNYITFSDSNAVYGEAVLDEEFWAPDGTGYAMTITFMPNDNGEIILAEGVVNNVTALGGSTGDSRYINPAKQCKLGDMGKLYSKIKQTFGTTITEQSSTYQNSAYTIFVELEPVGEIFRPNIYGGWNGTNLSPDCPKATPTGDISSSEPPIAPGTGEQPSQPSNPDTPEPDVGGSGTTPQPKPETPTQPPKPEEDVARIPAGAVYYVGVTTTQTGDYTGYTAKYVEGDPFPVLQGNDVYVYGDYEYRYNQTINNTSTLNWEWRGGNGWSAKAVDVTKTHYGTILSNINGKPVIDISAIFAYCNNLVESPSIPESVIEMYAAYYKCNNLSVTPYIPQNVERMAVTFAYCSKLTTPPVIPAKVNSLPQAFRECTSLTGIMEINAKDTAYTNNCFLYVDFERQNLTLTGTYTIYEELVDSSYNFCKICKGVCKENHE